MNPLFLIPVALVLFALGIAATKLWQKHAADEETIVLRAVIKGAEKLQALKKPATVEEAEAAAAKTAKLDALRLRAKASVDGMF